MVHDVQGLQPQCVGVCGMVELGVRGMVCGGAHMGMGCRWCLGVRTTATLYTWSTPAMVRAVPLSRGHG